VKKTNLLFWGIVTILFFSYSYQEILFYPIHSIHSWRQADCVSLAKNFINESNLLEPSIHNYISDGGKSGKTAGEFTLLYFIIGKIWNLTGVHLWIYRAVNLGLLLFSLFHLYKGLIHYWKSKFWSLFTSLIILTSPIIVYYGNSFLTNTTGIACAILGWSFFMRYKQLDKSKWLVGSLLLFTLAGLFKITAAVSIVALFGVFIFEILFQKKLSFKIFDKRKWLTFFLFVMSFLLIGAWYVYAEKYNQIHGGKYTFNDIWAVWMLDDEHYNNAVHFFKHITYFQLFPKLITWVLAIMALFSFYATWKKGIQYFLLYVFLILGFTTYIILWFGALENHDYYFINLFILPIIVITIIVDFYLKKTNGLIPFKYKTITLSLFILGVIYSSNNISLRYSEKLNPSYKLSKLFNPQGLIDFWHWTSSTQRDKGLFTIKNYLKKIGVKESDLVISYPDPTFNYSLIYLNRKGWTSFNNNSHDPNIVRSQIDLGAKYLIINKPQMKATNQNLDSLKTFFQDSVGSYEAYTVYKL